MSAIDELRKLLNECGVKHNDHYFNTSWRDRHGTLHLASEMCDNSLLVDMLTPEQAIAATLGRADELNSRAKRTCRNTSDSNYFRCSVCRKKTYQGEETFNYCPNCGAKVVEK